MQNFIWLSEPIHKNHIDIDISEPSISEFIKTSFDGSIMAVHESKVQSYLADDDVKMIRLGMKQPPKIKKVDSEDLLWQVLAYAVEL